jgi:NAD(P)H-hydrate epimerase
VVVLKGAGTAVAAPDGELIVNPTGGPALATGGTGDVLLGVVTGLLAQGVPAHRAAALAAFVHGAAGDRIAARRGDTGLLASELLAVLPAVITALRDAPAPAPFERELAAAFPEP